MLIAPRYGDASLADLVPSVLAGLGVPGEVDRIGLDLAGRKRVCVLMIDGLGAQLLGDRAAAAPFLASLQRSTLTAGFPSTTATSLSSLGTGLPPGQHGIVGYLLAVPGQDRLMNPLQWRLHGPGPRIDLLKEVVPEQFQPTPTAFDRAAAHGIAVSRVGPSYQDGSGLTRAALRGGTFQASFSMGDLVSATTDALRAGDRSLVYSYHGDLDLTGHIRGPHSEAWALELAQVDLMASAIADRLPSDAALVVTGDHGMVEVSSPIDVDSTADLQEGVRLLGGEPRARHVYTRAGAAADVLATWCEFLGAGFLVASRAETIDSGWFGPIVTPAALSRIGDVVAVAQGPSALIRRGAEPLQSMLLGHHGSLTAAEMNVPLVVFRG